MKMKKIPARAKPYKRTPEFTEQTVPAGLVGRHSTIQGVWAMIHVTEGNLVYRILEPAIEEYLLEPARPGIVEPQTPHQVQLVGPVRFYVEFHRMDPEAPEGR
jgi:tellurite resistance-related uncharacterized protein